MCAFAIIYLLRIHVKLLTVPEPEALGEKRVSKHNDIFRVSMEWGDMYVKQIPSSHTSVKGLSNFGTTCRAMTRYETEITSKFICEGRQVEYRKWKCQFLQRKIEPSYFTFIINENLSVLLWEFSLQLCFWKVKRYEKLYFGTVPFLFVIW